MPIVDPKLQKLRQDDFEPEGLLLRMPPTRGAMVPHAPLAQKTWFHVGGDAEILFTPVDENDLSFFLAHCHQDIPITVLGSASNVLIRDGGIPGVVIKLGTPFATIKPSGTDITAGASAIDPNIARAAQNAGISGLEFLCGIPGTVGGGLRMNAGAYGGSYQNIVTSATAMDRVGKKHHLYNDQIGFGYRSCSVPPDWIFLEATFCGGMGNPATIEAKMKELLETRKNRQPIRQKTCGSTFANPADDPMNRKAWQLIELAGCRGLRIGDAEVSEKHSNFLINRGKATAADIENLGEEVRRRVYDITGIKLRWEIKRLGVKKQESSDA